MDSLERLKAGIEAVNRHALEAGRSKKVGTAYSAGWYEDRRPMATADGSRRFLTGEPGQVAQDLRGLERLGVSHVILGFQAPSPAEIMKRMERFASVVRPLLAA